MSQSEFCHICINKSSATLEDVDAVSVIFDVCNYLSVQNLIRIFLLLRV